MESWRTALPVEMFELVAAWLALGACFVGIGVLCERLVGSRPETADGWLRAFFVGFAATIVGLQASHLVLPVGPSTLAAFAAVGIAGLLMNAPAIARAIARAVTRAPVPLLLTIAATLAVAKICLGGPRNGDSGFYHVPTVLWFLSYPIVPGLANLFAALAYNQSYFLYMALLEIGPIVHKGSHVANGLLVLPLIARATLALQRMLSRRARIADIDLFWMLLAPCVVARVADHNITSPTPDIAVFALGMVIAAELVRFVAAHSGRRSDLPIMALVAGTAITVKLSLFGIAVAAPVLALLVWWLRARPTVGSALGTPLAMGVAAALPLGLWMVRGIVMSGYPLYPSTIGGVSADWAAPEASVVAEANLIRYWNGVPDWQAAALRDPRWFARWLVTLGWLEREPLLPLGLAVLLGIVALFTFRRRRGSGVGAVVLLPTIFGLLFNFAAAPRARYAFASFWILVAQCGVLIFHAVGRTTRAVLTLVVFTLCALPLYDEWPVLPPLHYFEEAQRPAVEPKTLASGLVVGVPSNRTLCCWEAPLPCTPYPNEQLKLRDPNDLGKGFRIDPTVPVPEPVPESPPSAG
jgi:hypothetical protein